jgi:beta-fructofuranosidase
VTAAQPVAGDFSLVYDPSDGLADRWYINDHTFIRDHGGTWHLVGITHREPLAPFEELDLAHAIAPTLHGPWTREPDALSADQESGETHLWAPHIVEHDGAYWMFYCGGGASGPEYRIHLATSEDCVSWKRHEENPMVVDGFEARDPMVLRVGDRWVMYYTATSAPEGGHHVVAATESTDLVHWHGRHVVYRDPMSGTAAGPTESPFVVEHAGSYFLLIGPDYEELVRSKRETGRYDPAAYRRTRVLASDDPMSFDPADQVSTIDAHAPEVIRDEDGGWWVSHCGWGQGGVYLAPLTWADSGDGDTH